MALLDTADVRGLIPEELLDDTQIDVAMRVVAGWLRRASSRTDVDALADTDPLWDAAVELVVMLVTNPTGLEQRMVGPVMERWQRASPGLRNRRDQILDEVKSTYINRPSGSFPCPPRDPDPDWQRGYLVRWSGGR